MAIESDARKYVRVTGQGKPEVIEQTTVPVKPTAHSKPKILTGESVAHVPIELKEHAGPVPQTWTPRTNIPVWKYGPPKSTAIQPATEYAKYLQKVKEVRTAPKGTVIVQGPEQQKPKEQLRMPGSDFIRNLWYGKQETPEQVWQAPPDVKYNYGPSSKQVMAESLTNVGIGFAGGSVIRVAAPAAETATGWLRNIYRGSKVVMGGAFATGVGADIGYTAHLVRTGGISSSELANKSLQMSLGFGGFAYGIGGKGFSRLNKTPFESKGADYSGFNKKPWKNITEISSKGINEGSIKSTLLDEPYTEEFLVKQFRENPSIKSRGLTEKDFVKTYGGRSPRELLLNAREIQSKVRTGATWIQEKTVMKGQGTALRNLTIEGKNKPGLIKLKPFEPMPKLETNGNVGGEFLKTEQPKTTMKISKPFEFTGEKRMPTPQKDIDLLISKVGEKPKSILNLPERQTASTMGSTEQGFSNMDELGGFKKMYGRRTITLMDEEQPMVSRRWENQFRERPSRPTHKMSIEELKTDFGFKSIQATGIGSLLSQDISQTQEEVQLNLNLNIQDRLQRQSQIQRQFNRNISIQRTNTLQNMRVDQMQEQIQQQIQKQEQISLTKGRTVTNPKPKTGIPPLVPFLPNDVFNNYSFVNRHKKNYVSKYSLIELRIPTMKDIFGG